MYSKYKVGYRGNGLVVLERLSSNDCRCLCLTCGREDYICRTSHLDTNKTGSCGCLLDHVENTKFMHTANLLTRNKMPRHFWTGAKHRHLACGFSEASMISFDRLFALWHEQQGRCALSGAPIDLYVYKRGPLEVHAHYPLHHELENRASLDRKDSRLGYIDGNVQWVLQHYNFLKWDFSSEYLLHLCEELVKHQQALPAHDPHKIASFEPGISLTRAKGLRLHRESDKARG